MSLTFPNATAALLHAHRTGQAVSSAAVTECPNDAEAAYAVHEQVGQALGLWSPTQPSRYWKCGGASRKGLITQSPLPAAGVHETLGASVNLADWRQLPWPLQGIEPEIALRLGQDVTPALASSLTHAQAVQLIDDMAVSLEAVASRWTEQAQAAEWLRMADFQSHAALALGPWQAFDTDTPRDWSQQRYELHLGTGEVIQGTGGHSLNDPSWLLPAWLRHLTRHGATVPAGTVVTTGSWRGLVPVAPGQTVTLKFEGLGEVSVRV